LAYMHSKNVINHDIKFDNAGIPILEHNGNQVLDLENIHLFDFDVSDRVTSNNSLATTSIGTNGWISPEKDQAASSRPYNPFKSDLYTLALVMGLLFIPEEYNDLLRMEAHKKADFILNSNKIPDKMKEF